MCDKMEKTLFAIIAISFVLALVSGCVEPPTQLPVCGNGVIELGEECDGTLSPCEEKEGFEVSCEQCKCTYAEKEPIEPPAEKPLWGFGSITPLHNSNYWWCSDNKHLTNGITTIECIAECRTVDGRDRCIDPKIPPYGTGRTYECVGANWIKITENGKTSYYYCQAGCEVMADGTTMCWCGTDKDCGNPDAFPGGLGKGGSGAWHCTDYWHFSNGKETVFCELGCIDDICYHPEIPESMPPCCYECIGANRMKVTCDGVSNEYDCVNGCENRGKCIDICFIDSDDDGLNPDPKDSGSTVDIMGAGSGDGEDEDTENENNDAPAEFCGDGICNAEENCETCSEDCDACPPIEYCGDGICQDSEDETGCPVDCETGIIPGMAGTA